jgi:hypothetical protein
MTSRQVHRVGSIGLDTVEEVFATVGELLKVKRSWKITCTPSFATARRSQRLNRRSRAIGSQPIASILAIHKFLSAAHS